MDKKSLNCFITLAETLHYRKTSELCCLTPSALSKMICRLEDEVGEALFERNNRSVALTQTGEAFYDFAKSSLDLWEDFQSKINFKDPLKIKGNIKIFCTVTSSYSILPKIIKSFRNIYPNIMTYVETGISIRGFNKLEIGDIDFAIGIISEKSIQKFDYQKIFETPLLYVTSKENNNQNLNTPVILHESSEVTKIIEKWFKKQQVKPVVHSYVAGNEAILAMVAAGLGNAVISKLVIDNSHLGKEVKIVTDLKPLPNLEIGIFMKKSKNHSHIKNLFWDFIKNPTFLQWLAKKSEIIKSTSYNLL